MQINLIMFLYMYVSQYGLGLVHLLHGGLRHHPQLLHEDGDWVPAQTEALWTRSARGANLPGPGGLSLLPWHVCPVHLQLYRCLPKPRKQPREQSWENALPSGPGGPGRQHRVSGRRAVLRGRISGTAQVALLWPDILEYWLTGMRRVEMLSSLIWYAL